MRQIIIVIVALTIGVLNLACPGEPPRSQQNSSVFQTNDNGGAETPIQREVGIILDETFPVEATQYVSYSFQSNIPIRLNGRFTAKGGRGDIEGFVLDNDEMVNFKKRLSFRTYYSSGIVSIGNVDLKLSPGKYYTVFRNKALLTNKVVKAKFTAQAS